MDERRQVARIEGLLEEVESLPDPGAREKATELIAALLDLYGEAFARIVERVAEADLVRRLCDDELVSQLLILHGLHPVPLETRVRSALDDVRPYLESHGGGVQLLGIEDRVVRLRLDGTCNGCPSSAVTLKLAIEEAIYEHAPDVAAIDAQGAEQPPQLLQIEVAKPVWQRVDTIPEGAPLLRSVSGELLLLVNVAGTHYAYRPTCPSCEGSLGNAVVCGRELECSGCGHRYDVVAAGRGLDAPDMHLDPVPLLSDNGDGIRVAVGSPA
jgi:Fe-S cluster biogenesis protein NfuA/nitrite reductase/ring-hydroxylating ferredoxin subunit